MLVSLAFFVVIFPLISQAKIISIVSSFFNGEKEEIEFLPNSQNMALLEASAVATLSVGGGDITIIDGSALVSESGPTGYGGSLFKENNGEISIYVVHEGDSLSQIADMFGVSINTIRWGNDISGSTISPGQTLVILPVSGVRHTVKSGETLASIAKLYKGDFNEIITYNDISEDTKLSVGESIIIPGGVLPETASVSKSKTSVSKSSGSATPDGYYVRPINGGRRTQGIHGYNAVDLAAPEGTSIFASAAGVVTVSRNSGWNGGYGNYVVISHSNGTQTLYAHNSRSVVGSGERVSQGQLVGYVGSTGRSSGPHVHFEVRGAKNPF